MVFPAQFSFRSSSYDSRTIGFSVGSLRDALPRADFELFGLYTVSRTPNLLFLLVCQGVAVNGKNGEIQSGEQGHQ